MKLRIREHALSSALIPRDDRVAIVTVAQEILGKVQPRSEKPARAQFVVRRCHAIDAANNYIPWILIRIFRVVRAVCDYFGESPHQLPELVGMQNGPAVKLVVRS